MKRQNIIRCCSTIICCSFLLTLSSCALQDPKFLANVGNIRDTDYPKDKIVGQWATVAVSQFQSTSEQEEHKMYFDIRSDGRGRIRQVEMNKVNGAKISMEAGLNWTYFGKNKWRLTLPPSTAYRVTDTNGYQMGSWGVDNETLRYYNGELYMTPSCLILVKPTQENISEMANRQRNQAPLLYIDETAQ